MLSLIFQSLFMSMKYRCLLLLVLWSVCGTTQAQDSAEVYHVKPVYEFPVAAGLLSVSYFGFRALDRTAIMTTDEVLQLNPDNVNAFDRPVIYNNPAWAAKAQSNADFFLNFSILSPVVLALDKKVRRDWLDLVSLYLTTHVVDNAIYFAAAYSVRRPRPYIYNNNIPIEYRVGEAKNNSFFSGHVSFSTTSTFFLVKVLTDYNHIRGWKRLGLYAAAAVPPALVGYYRMRGGKHFRTDVLLGFAVGGVSGIMIPELHKKWNTSKHVSFSPYFSPSGQSGLCLSYKF